MSTEIRLRPKFIRVLDAMAKGSQVEMDGQILALCETEEETPKPVVAFQVTRTTHGKDPEQVWMEAQHYTLNQFIQACESLSEEEIIGICAGAILRELRKR